MGFVLLPLLPCEVTAKTTNSLGDRLSSDPETACTLILNFLAFKTVRIEFLFCISYSISFIVTPTDRDTNL